MIRSKAVKYSWDTSAWTRFPMMIPQICNASKVGEGVLSRLYYYWYYTIQYYLYVQFGWKLLLVVGCTHHEDALHAEGVGDVRSRAGALSPPTMWGEMEAASYGEYRVVLHTTCFRLQLHQIGAVSCHDRCWVHHRCRNLAVPELQVAPNRSRHPNAIMRLEPKVILTVVLRLNVTSLSNMKSPF